MISSPRHPKLLNLVQKFAYIKMGSHSFCCWVRQGTDGEAFSPGHPSQGETGGGDTPALKSRTQTGTMPGLGRERGEVRGLEDSCAGRARPSRAHAAAAGLLRGLGPPLPSPSPGRPDPPFRPSVGPSGPAPRTWHRELKRA